MFGGWFFFARPASCNFVERRDRVVDYRGIHRGSNADDGIKAGQDVPTGRRLARRVLRLVLDLISDAKKLGSALIW